MIRSHLARQKALDVLRLTNIKTAPVNLDLVSEKLGFKIIPFEFPDSMSALLIIEGNDRVIGVNKSHPQVRQRFSVAHELGHFVSGHEDFNHEEVAHIDREKKYLNRFHRMEEEADEFAAELLMPESILKNDYHSYSNDIAELSKKYNVSQQAMTIQLINLKLLG